MSQNKYIIITICAFLLICNFANAQFGISGPSVVDFNSTHTYTETVYSTPPYYYTYYFTAVGGTVQPGQTETQVSITWNNAAYGIVQKWRYDTWNEISDLFCSFNVTVQNTPATGYFYDNAGNRTSRETITLNVNSLKSGSIIASEDSNESKTEDEKSIDRQLEGLDIKIYPNPTSGKLLISLTGLDQTKSSSISVMNINGAEIEKIIPASASNEIDLSKKADGVYILIITANSQSTEWKIVKQ